MAKINKEEAARREGMSYALRIAAVSKSKSERAISRILLCEFMKIRLKSGRSLQRNTKNTA